MSAQAKAQRNRDDTGDPTLRRPEDFEFLQALERAIEATIRLQNAPMTHSQGQAQQSEFETVPEPQQESDGYAAEAEPPELAPLSTTPAPIRPMMRERDPEAGHPLLRGQARMDSLPMDEQSRREAAIEILRQRRRPEPDDFLVPPPRRRWDGVAVASRLMMAAGIVVSIGFVIYHFTSAAPQAIEQATSASPAQASLVGRAPADHQPTNKPVRRLVLTELSGAANRPVALGVTVDGPPQGAVVVVRGLPSNSRITAGAAAGEGAWRIPANELVRAAVVPPPDYVGVMNLSIDLTLADGSLLDSDVLRLSWTPTQPDAITPKPVRTTTIAPEAAVQPPSPPVATAPPTSQAASTPPAAPAPQAAPIPQTPAPAAKPATTEPSARQPAAAALRQLDRGELDMLVRRAHVFLENGDISAARLLLRRAAEAGDVRATLALATTYDPVVLRQIGALGAKDDIAQARHWYQKASELGSAEAVMRLQRLAQETR
jgi:hypothetical protein